MEAYLGEIRMFAGPYAPQGWALCDGSSLSVSGNEALYALIGTTWGGDTTNFKLPDLRGRLPIGQGQGTSLTARTIGQTGGGTQAALDASTLPAHTHAVMASTAAATSTEPGAALGLATTAYPGSSSSLQPLAYLPANTTGATKFVLGEQTISTMGGGGAHDNVMPSLSINYIICTQGIYPTQH
ncbi:microcystin dependent MdpB family protein [Aliidongia dinghuensis]|uniref:Microcystin dependent MdpB family protein n=1 Tax=Aliidongia dinghuensis TaxID=1867774 RepID=A0A8J2YQE6_9PROT|nr:tail fiber protein [Aliidongia dinghuensis]GGF06779.1 microcystin dependent MdpB family protein [Aliidongia dinghuensis]